MTKESWEFFYYLKPAEKSSEDLFPFPFKTFKVSEETTVRQFIEDLMAFRTGWGFIKVKDPTPDAEQLWYLEYDGDCLANFPESFYSVLDRQIETVLWAGFDDTSATSWAIILKSQENKIFVISEG